MGEVKPNSAPAVVFWYKIYCGGMALIYIAVLILFTVGIVAGWTELIAKEGPLPQWFYAGYFTFIFFICGTLTIVFITAFFLKAQPWTWIYHLILICLGLTSPCLLPASVPLLIFWIKPETRLYFGRT